MKGEGGLLVKKNQDKGKTKGKVMERDIYSTCIYENVTMKPIILYNSYVLIKVKIFMEE